MTTAILHPYARPIAEIAGRPGHFVYRPFARAVCNGFEREYDLSRSCEDFSFSADLARSRAIETARELAGRIDNLNILIAI